MTDASPQISYACRFLYAADCHEDGFVTVLARDAHEREAHEQVELTFCAECGEDKATPQARAVHLSHAHGLRAGSPERFDADVREVERIAAARREAEGVVKSMPEVPDEETEATVFEFTGTGHPFPAGEHGDAGGGTGEDEAMAPDYGTDHALLAADASVAEPPSAEQQILMVLDEMRQVRANAAKLLREKAGQIQYILEHEYLSKRI